MKMCTIGEMDEVVTTHQQVSQKWRTTLCFGCFDGEFVATELMAWVVPWLLLATISTRLGIMRFSLGVLVFGALYVVMVVCTVMAPSIACKAARISVLGVLVPTDPEEGDGVVVQKVLNGRVRNTVFYGSCWRDFARFGWIFVWLQVISLVVWHVSIFVLRYSIRQEFEIRGHLCIDGLLSCCCSCCVIAEMRSQLQQSEIVKEESVVSCATKAFGCPSCQVDQLAPYDDSL